MLKLNAELKVSFPAYLDVFSKATTRTSLKLLEAYPLAADMPAAPRDALVETIRQTARSGEKYAISKYDAICAAAKEAAVFGRALQSNAVRIQLYVKACQEYQGHLDSILKGLHKAVDWLEGTRSMTASAFPSPYGAPASSVRSCWLLKWAPLACSLPQRSFMPTSVWTLP